MKNGDYILVVAPDDYPGMKYRGRYCYEHRLVYWKEHGIVLGSGYVIHHINGDKHDNRPENLALLANDDHVAAHNNERSMGAVTLRCPNCHREFVRPWGRRIRKFCSRRCSCQATKPHEFRQVHSSVV